MSGNRLAGGFKTLELNAQRFLKEGNPSFSLFVVYRGPSFMEVAAGQSLVLEIDGRRVELNGRGSKDHRVPISIGLVEETSYYHDVAPDLLRDLASSTEVTVVLRGDSGTLKRRFSKKNFEAFRRFWEQAGSGLDPAGK